MSSSVVPPVATEQTRLRSELESIRSSSLQHISPPLPGGKDEYDGGLRGDDGRGEDEESPGSRGPGVGDWESLEESEVDAELLEV